MIRCMGRRDTSLAASEKSRERLPVARPLPFLLLTATLACSRAPTSTDCPPTSTETGTPTKLAEPEPEPEPELPATAEALTVTADDGHALRLWSLTTAEAGSRPAIVLVHGRTWSSLPDFDLRVGEDPSLSLMHTLARRGWATYALDLRGYGGTERDAKGYLTPDRAAEDLAAALTFVSEREGAAPALLGWSFGALVSQLCVQRHPEAARALVLYGYPRDLDQVAPVAEAKGPPPRTANTEAAARSDFITEGTISAEAIDAYVKASIAADPIRADWTALHQFNALDPEQITIPTLVIYGVDDPIAKPLWQAKLFTRMTVPDRQWVIVPNADHAAHLEQPAAFVRALLAFLDRGPA
jgi:pimeloyl-ACP methyl ester carboxylesterase